MRNTWVVGIMFLVAVSSSASESVPEILYARKYGACESGNLRFGAISVTAFSPANDGAIVDVHVHLERSGIAQLVFSDYDSEKVARAVKTSWTRVKDGVIAIDGIGSLYYFADAFDPSKLEMIAFKVESNAFYPPMPVSPADDAFVAVLSYWLKWDGEGRTAAEVCASSSSN